MVAAIATAADDDPWRQQFRAAAIAGDATALRALSDQARRLSLPPSRLSQLAARLVLQGDRDEALALLRWARGRHLTDFWIHYHLGLTLAAVKDQSPAILEESDRLLSNSLGATSGCLRCPHQPWRCTAGQERVGRGHRRIQEGHRARPQARDRPHQPRRRSLGQEPVGRGHRRIQEGHRARPQGRFAHDNLGRRTACQEPIGRGHRPNSARPSNSTPSSQWPTTTSASALQAKNQLDEAMAEFRKAIELDPKFAMAHFNLGMALKAKNQLDEAIAEYRKAIELDPKLANAHYQPRHRSACQEPVGRGHRRIQEGHRARPQVRNGPQQPRPRRCRPRTSWTKPSPNTARSSIFKQIYAEANCNLANILQSQGQLSASLDFYKRGHASGSKRKDWRYPSAQWVANAERLVRLEAKLRRRSRGESHGRRTKANSLASWKCAGSSAGTPPPPGSTPTPSPPTRNWLTT